MAVIGSRAQPLPTRSPSPAVAAGQSRWTLCAFTLVLLADVVLKIGGFGRLHRLTRRWPTLGHRPAAAAAVAAEIREAVDRCRVYYPKRAWCLQASAAAVWLMRIRGVPAQLVLGAQKFPFYAHAWVEVDGLVVNDEAAVQETYAILEKC